MTPISDELFILQCFNSVDNIARHDYYAGVIFTILHNTGLRYVEVYEVSRWTDMEDDTFLVDTAKNSTNRIIPYSNIPDEYKQRIKNGEDEFKQCRYRQSSRYFNKFYPIFPIYTGNKSLTTHAYRYAKMKKMYIEGSTLNEIQEYMGEVDIQHVESYVNALIYTD